jgi:outer membrane protein assembly factor BamD (BamD/ComL family)
MRQSSPQPESPQNAAELPLRTNAARLSLLAGVFLCGFLACRISFAPITAHAQSVSTPSIGDFRSALGEGDEASVRAAMKILLQLEKQSETDFSLEFLRLARAPGGHLSSDEVNQLYFHAIGSLDHVELSAENVPQRLLIRATVAVHFSSVGDHEQAAKVLVDALDELGSADPQVSATRARQLLKLAMQNAWAELNSSRPGNAEDLYRKIVDLSRRDGWGKMVSSHGPIAMLGLGWATAMQPDRGVEAAERLLQFIDTYPSHDDAPRAAALRIRCLQKTDQAGESVAAVSDFVSRWPSSPFAQQVVSDALLADLAAEDASLRDGILDWIIHRGTPENWPAPLVAQALAMAGSKLPPPRFDALMERLAAADQTGHQTAVLLSDSKISEDRAVAEQIAATLISGDLKNSSPMARESACRWAGRSGRWSLLALAADSESIVESDDRRTAHTERLFAEALMQTGRTGKAAIWWAHVVDQRDATDFATLLRCAECAAAHSEIPEAKRRLDRVRRALVNADEQPDVVAVALVDLLEGDLAVRELDFSRARSLFEQVVRSPRVSPTLRGRAQWMIGETHFMQRQFTQAIDAYRQVEGLDPSGSFVAAAMVQAGKSFEQLGRTREAGVCYGTLLGRFTDSGYAVEARRRMAALPNGSGNNSIHGGAPAQNKTSPGSSRLRR